MATILVLSLGSKFIPKRRDANLKFTFKKFEDFKKRLQNKIYFLETAPGTFCFDYGHYHTNTHTYIYFKNWL